MGPPPNNKNCCVVGCHSKYSKSPGTKFFFFPSRPWETERRERWIQLVHRKNEDGTDWRPSKNSRICSKHFVGNIKASEESHPSYHPSIFPSVYKKRSAPGAHRRFKRQMEREKKKAAARSEEPPQHPDSPIPSTDDSTESTDQSTTGSCSSTASTEEVREITPVQCDLVTEEVNEITRLQFDLVDASTMTEDQPECFTGELIFLSVISNCTASCFVSHKTTSTVEQGTVCDVELCDKVVGPVHKQPYFGGFKALCCDESALQSLTAVSYQIFALLLSVLPASAQRTNELSLEDKLLLFLIKLKHGLPFSFLATLFSIHSTTASRNFKTIFCNLKSATKTWIYWPSRTAVQQTIPASFREHYPMCRVIIDCTELETEMPPGVEKRNLWFSNYKGRYTLKYLIGIAPNGLITFVSEGFGGRTTDAVITTEGKLLSLLEPGDVILADKGFPGIRTGVGEQQATLVMPPFATSAQFTESEVDATYETASVRINVERVIQRLKIFQILTNRIPHELAGYVDDILHVVAVITNIKPGIFAKNDCMD